MLFNKKILFDGNLQIEEQDKFVEFLYYNFSGLRRSNNFLRFILDSEKFESLPIKIRDVVIDHLDLLKYTLKTYNCEDELKTLYDFPYQIRIVYYNFSEILGY